MSNLKEVAWPPVWWPLPSGTSYVDMSRNLFDPFVQHLSRFLNQLRPDLLWTFIYIATMGLAYLFHSPFRTHSAAAVDTYGRSTKILQTWTMVTLFCFHVAPTILAQKQRQLEDSHTEEDIVAAMFMPLVIIFTMGFMALHKVKRMWRMGVTYGARYTIILMNALVVASLCTVHYIWCTQLLRQSGSTMRYVKPMVRLVSPPSIAHHPYSAVGVMVFLGLVFIMADYQYKRIRSFDPQRGVLWAELYQLQKLYAADTPYTAAEGSHGDWRLLVSQPHHYRGCHVKDVSGHPTAPPAVRGAGDSAARRGSAALYHESSFLARGDSAIQQEDYEEHDATLHRLVHPSASAPSSSPLSSTAPASTEVASFHLQEDITKELRDGLHPMGKPGMVPWWSTFVLYTAWQAAASTMLGFLAFDVRALQSIVTPKILNLRFHSTLDSIAEEENRTTQDDDADTKEREFPDVWFDWIADVGDGYNPTYSMARLLAQPELVLRSPLPPTGPGTSKKAHADSSGKRSRSADGKGRSSRQRATSMDASANTADSAAAAAQLRSSTPHKAHSTHSGPLHHSPSSHTLLLSPHSGESLNLLSSPRDPLSHASPPVSKHGLVSLPRGSFVVVGGDLAYPSPDDETYTKRLFGPYSDALHGSRRLQELFHREQKRLVVRDAADEDVAHVHLLDAATVSRIAAGRDPLRASRGTVEEALRSLPLLFAIPGNHDWFDGLSTYRKYILEKTWIGGWLMPQRSSYFVLRLPCNWFMLCGDTGNTQDIDVAQRNYFLDVVERYMDERSCVILAAHEPGWLFDAVGERSGPSQPELEQVAAALGTRLRLRIAGDIHNYSRHVPVDPLSEAPTLIVSGGGGAFLHGQRDDQIISYGNVYRREAAFPSGTSYMNLARRLWGFRVVNWKFDLIIGVLCLGLAYSLLPLPFVYSVGASRQEQSTSMVLGDITDASQMFTVLLGFAAELMSHLFSYGVISLFPFAFYLSCFSLAGEDRGASWVFRLGYGAFWTCCVTYASYVFLSAITLLVAYLANTGMSSSTEDQWKSVLEDKMRNAADLMVNRTIALAGGAEAPVGQYLFRGQQYLYGGLFVKAAGFVARLADPVEALTYLSHKVGSGKIGVFAASATRAEIFFYYMYFAFFYWIVTAPVVSAIIGFFLLFSVTTFDYMYDATYCAFQIEDYKSFIRFRLDTTTRELHGYVVSERKPSRVFSLDSQFMKEISSADAIEGHLPSHLRRYPSRWIPAPEAKRRTKDIPTVLEQFVVAPHRTE